MTTYNPNSVYTNNVYQNSFQHEGVESESSSEDENYNQEPKRLTRETYKRSNLMIIYSGDRNYTGGETTFNYNIQFSPQVSSQITQKAFFLKSLKNIRSITIKDVLLPNFYLDVDTLNGLFSDNIITKSEVANNNIIRLPRLSDLPYIVLRINEMGSTFQGTNHTLNQATCMLTIQDSRDTTTNVSGKYEYKTDSTFVSIGNNANSTISSTDKKVLRFQNSNTIQKIYYPTPHSTLGDFQVEFFDHLGNPLRLQSDYLLLESVNINGGNQLKLTFTKYFSPDEYRVGDIITLKSAAIQTGSNLNLEQHLNRKNGHIILGMSDVSGSNGSLYKSILVAFPYTINLTTGATTKDTLEVSGEIAMSNGHIINHNLQHSISLIVETEEYNYNQNSAILI